MDRVTELAELRECCADLTELRDRGTWTGGVESIEWTTGVEKVLDPLGPTCQIVQ